MLGVIERRSSTFAADEEVESTGRSFLQILPL